MTPFAIAGLQLHLGVQGNNLAHILARIAWTMHM
jgi:hypothetical protein